MNSKERFSETLLHLAANFNFNKLLKFLCTQTKISIFETNKDSKTAQSICEDQGNLEGAEFLKQFDKSHIFANQLLNEAEGPSKSKKKRQRKSKKAKLSKNEPK